MLLCEGGGDFSKLMIFRASGKTIIEQENEEKKNVSKIDNTLD